MHPISEGVRNAFFDINKNIFHSIKNDLILGRKRKTYTEKLQDSNRKQFFLIRQLQDQVSYQNGIIDALKRENRELKDLLTRKDKEIETLRKKIKSQEIRSQ